MAIILMTPEYRAELEANAAKGIVSPPSMMDNPADAATLNAIRAKATEKATELEKLSSEAQGVSQDPDTDRIVKSASRYISPGKYREAGYSGGLINDGRAARRLAKEYGSDLDAFESERDQYNANVASANSLADSYKASKGSNSGLLNAYMSSRDAAVSKRADMGLKAEAFKATSEKMKNAGESVDNRKDIEMARAAEAAPTVSQGSASPVPKLKSAGEYDDNARSVFAELGEWLKGGPR